MTQVGPIRVNTRTFAVLYEKNSLSTKISSCKKSDVILELLGKVHYMEKKKKTEPLAYLEPLDPTVPEAIAQRLFISKSLPSVFKISLRRHLKSCVAVFIHYLL